jgi:hypothetical protein
MIAIIGIQMVSPTMWKLSVTGITAFAKTGSLVFSVAALIENGNAAALDIVLAAVTIAEKILRIMVELGFPETFFAATNHNHK